VLTERFPGIGHETRPGTSGPVPGMNHLQSLRLFKMAPDAYAEWLQKTAAEAAAKAAETDAQGRPLVNMRNMGVNGTGAGAGAGGAGAGGEDGSGPGQGHMEVFYHRADVYDEFGPVAKDLEVRPIDTLTGPLSSPYLAPS